MQALASCWGKLHPRALSVGLSRDGGGGLARFLFLQSWQVHVGAGFRTYQSCSVRAYSTRRVSSHGRVLNAFGNVSHGQQRPDGYMRYQVNRVNYYVHRIVARTFLGAPPSSECKYVNHKDGDPSNSHVVNLEYVTHAANIQLSFELNPSRSTGGPARSKPVLSRERGSNDWVWHSSLAEAANVFGVRAGNISTCCHGRAPSTGGMYFRFAQPLEPDVLDGEVWKPSLHPNTGAPVEGSRVSSLGRVASVYGIISWGHTSPLKYKVVKIGKATYRIHRIVARTFLGPPPSPDHTQVNHKDGDPANNHVDNLEYVTPGENVRHSWLRNPDRENGARFKEKAVVARLAGGSTWKHYLSASVAARELKVCACGISKCCRGVRPTALGYEFRFATSGDSASFPGEEWRDLVLPERLSRS